MKFNYWEKFEEESFYHIYNRGINRTSIFLSDDNKYYFLGKWKTLICPYFDTIAYCLMDNHFHFLVKVKSMNEVIKDQIRTEGTSKSMKFLKGEINHNDFLEDQFKRLFSAYVLAFNKQQERTGSLLQKRFKRIKVKNEWKLFYLIAYIHHNPIHHKFCRHFGQWKFCSYQSYLSSDPDFINQKEILTLFDKEDPQLAKLLFTKFHLSFKMEKSLTL